GGRVTNRRARADDFGRNVANRGRRAIARPDERRRANAGRPQHHVCGLGSGRPSRDRPRRRRREPARRTRVVSAPLGPRRTPCRRAPLLLTAPDLLAVVSRMELHETHIVFDCDGAEDRRTHALTTRNELSARLIETLVRLLETSTSFGET